MISKYRYILISALFLLFLGVFYLSGFFNNKSDTTLKVKPTPQASQASEVTPISTPVSTPVSTPISTPISIVELAPSPIVEQTVTPLPAATAIISKEPSVIPRRFFDLFTQTDCGVDITFGKTNAKALFEPKPLIEGKEISGIQAISTSKMTDGAGYGYKFGNSFALHDNGSLFAWGLQNFHNSSLSSSFPQLIKGLPIIIQTEGEFALSADGQVWYLNHGDTPFAIQDLNHVKTMRQDGMETLIVLKTDQSIWTWHTVDGKPQGKLASFSIKMAQQIYAGLGEFYVIQTNGSLWKASSAREETDPDAFMQISLPQFAKAVQVDTTFIYNKAFIKTDQDIWYEYQLEGKITKAEMLKDMVKVAGNYSMIVALKKDGTVWSWDDRSELMHSDGYTGSLNKAVQVQGIQDAKDIQAGSDHVLVLTQAGKLLSWGSNMYGQLGRIPFYYDKLTTVGTMKNIKGISPSWRGLYIFHENEVWILDGNQKLVPVFQGRSIKKTVTLADNSLFLTNEGEIIILGSEIGQCHVIRGNTPILDIEGDHLNLLVHVQSNEVYEVILDQQKITQVNKLRFEPVSTGKINKMINNVLPFVFTDKGEMYAQDHLVGNEWVMKPIKGLPIIQEASPLFGSFYGGEGSIAKVLDHRGEVYNIHLTLERKDSEIISKAFKTIKTGEKAEHLLGAMTISHTGLLQEKEGFKVQDQLKPGDEIRQMASSYLFSNGGEGQSTFFHVFVLQDGRIQWLGYSPFNHEFPLPGSVIVQ